VADSVEAGKDCPCLNRATFAGQPGYDGKKVAGRERFIVTDTLGALVTVMVAGQASPRGVSGGRLASPPPPNPVVNSPALHAGHD
jgi:hypothetical protein